MTASPLSRASEHDGDDLELGRYVHPDERLEAMERRAERARDAPWGDAAASSYENARAIPTFALEYEASGWDE